MTVHTALLREISDDRTLPRWVLLLAVSLVAFCPVVQAQSVAEATSETSVVVEGAEARARLTFYRHDVVRVDWKPRAMGAIDAALDTSLAVIRTPGEEAQAPMVQRRTTRNGYVLRTDGLTVEIEKQPMRVRFFDGTGQPLVEGAPEGSFAARDTAQALRFAIGSDTRFYGTGERGGAMDLRGRAFDSYNTQQYGYTKAPSVMKINVPLLTTSGGYALFFDSPWPGRFDIGASTGDRLEYAAMNEGAPARGSLTYYLIAGETPREQLEAYTWLTGRQPMPPRWSLGYVQSKYGYRTAEAARGVVDTLQQKNIPVSALVLDLYWFRHMGDLDWAENGNWDKPIALLEDLEDRGVKVVTITEPYLQSRADLYDEALTKGYVGARLDGSPYVMDNWWSCTAGAAFGTEAEVGSEGCDVALLDITDPEAQDWWWRQYPEFMRDEVDGFWTDLGEPERHPMDMQHAMGSTARVHNLYNLLWAKTLYEGFDEWRPNQRIFNLTRSGFAGIQRYGTFLWSGDVGRSFTTFDEQLPLMLNASLSGLGYYSSDLGGFTGDLYSPELYARWVSMGAFTPTMRVHGQDDMPTEPWGFGTEVEDIVRDYVRLRYRMLPYNYALARESHEAGTPLVRPVFFADTQSDDLLTNDEAFMWGDAFLVAPVTQEGARSQQVMLPRGTWTDYWTGEVYDGGRMVEVDAPLGRVPLFVKAGSLVPMRADARPMDAPFETVVLHVFPHASKPARFTLYEDDGESQAYRKGAYAKTRLVQRWADDPEGGHRLTLHVGPAAGSYDGLPAERVWRADVRQMAAAPSAVQFDGRSLPARASQAALDEAGRGYYYDADAERLYVQHRGRTDRSHRFDAHGVRLSR